MSGKLIRLAGALVGAAAGVAAAFGIDGAWGFLAGGVVFLGCTALSDWIWRRKATPEETRKDLEDRARDRST